MADPIARDAGRETGFRERLLSGQPLLGTFLKTAAPQIVEIVGSVGFDFVVIDQEHAPLGRESVDLLLLAARSRRLSALVRVPHAAEIGHALDSGAEGVIVPHVASEGEARSVVAACRYSAGSRGYSNSPRAGDYGRVPMNDHIRAQDEACVVVVMIEDAAAVARAEEILAVEGVHATLIGCADLAVSMGEPSADSPNLRRAVQTVSRAALCAGRRALAPAPSIPAAAWLMNMGVDALVIGSDQSLLRAGANEARRDFLERQAKMPGQAA